MLAQRMTNGSARLAGLHMIKPAFARQLVFAAHNLNLIAVF